MVIKEKFPEYKACVQIPKIGGFIDVYKINDLKDIPFDTYMVMSLEAAFIYKENNPCFFNIEENRNENDKFLPSEVRNYILDNIKK